MGCKAKTIMLRIESIARPVLQVFVASMVLSGCGGSSGDGDNNVPNESPVAGFTLSETDGLLPLPVFFDASGSSDSDGSIAAYEWSFGDGNTSTGATTNYTFNSIGEFQVSLTVVDNEGATSTTMQTVVVKAAPIAHIIQLLQ